MIDDIKQTLDMYVERGIPTGGFLQAVLENNLMEAMGRADMHNRERLFHICRYIYQNLPQDCWGSKKTVTAWITKGGKEGV